MIKIETKNKNNKIKNLKKPLSHSNSTRDIYTANSNIKKYLAKKINQLQNNSNQVKPIIKHPSSKSKINNNLIGNSSSKGGTSANIHINNYYTNNIYNAIYNNYMPRKIFNKNGKINKKTKHQRASSVLAPKRSSSKFKMYKNKEKSEKNINDKTDENMMLSNRIKKSMSRTNSTNKVNKANVRPNSEYTLNKKNKYNK